MTTEWRRSGCNRLIQHTVCWHASTLLDGGISLPNTYQGVAGAIQTRLLGLVSAAFFIFCGRNLTPLMLAHGIVNAVIFTGFYMGHSFPNSYKITGAHNLAHDAITLVWMFQVVHSASRGGCQV